MIHYVTFGVILDDIATWRGRVHMSVLGGGGPQTAWGMAAALGSGAQVGLVAGIGADIDSDIFDPLRAAGVDLTGVRTTDHPTPRAWQLVEADGRRTQVWRTPEITNGMQLAQTWDMLPATYRAARCFHWGIHPEHPSLQLASELNRPDVSVSLEAFRAPDAPLAPQALQTIMQHCSVFSVGESEAQAITGMATTKDAIKTLAHAGCAVLAVRRGSKGSVVWDFARGLGVSVPALSVEVVDETGAGNAYSGALLATLDQGLREAVCHATVAGAYMVEQVGLPARLPDRKAYYRRFDAAWKRSKSV